MIYYVDALRRYVDFSGRASRAQYWYFVLWNLLLSGAAALALFCLGSFIGGERAGDTLVDAAMGTYSLAIVIPSISVAVRRLHDIDASGWWILVGLIPGAGSLALIVAYCIPGTRGPNRFGPEPAQPPS